MTTPPRWILSLGMTVLAATLAIAQQPAGPGDALPGLTASEFEEFRLGLKDFLEVETTEDGLGPAYNATSCAVCHSVPAIGGVGSIAEVRAVRRLPSGEFEALYPSGETLFHLFSIPGHACQPVIPYDANVIVRRVPIAVFGAGLVEAIEDSTLLALEDPADRDRDGVSGRAALITDRATGIAVSAGLAGRLSTRRSSRSAATRIGTRWASPTISFPRSLRQE